MSVSKLKTVIQIIETTAIKDTDGFGKADERVIATVRAEMDERHGSESQTNMTTVSTTSTRFCFRIIPRVTVTTNHTIRHGGVDYRITSVMNIRGLVVEVMAEKIERSMR
jgi:hypothetical protein